MKFDIHIMKVEIFAKVRHMNVVGRLSNALLLDSSFLVEVEYDSMGCLFCSRS